MKSELRTTLKTSGYGSAITVSAGYGNLRALRAKSKSSSAAWLHVFDVAATPSNGDVPALPPIPLAAGGYYESDTRFDFVNGLYIAASSTEATFTAIAGTDFFISAQIN